MTDRHSYTIPLPGNDPDDYLVISARWPLTPARWVFVMTVLDAMQPALVTDAPDVTVNGGDTIALDDDTRSHLLSTAARRWPTPGERP